MTSTIQKKVRGEMRLAPPGGRPYSWAWPGGKPGGKVGGTGCPAGAGPTSTTDTAALLHLGCQGKEEVAISTLSAQNSGH